VKDLSLFTLELLASTCVQGLMTISGLFLEASKGGDFHPDQIRCVKEEGWEDTLSSCFEKGMQ